MPGRCVAGRPTVPIPIPTLIKKAGSPAYPGLAANEFLCLQAARRAGIRTPASDLSHDGQLLLLDRFDIEADGQRLGFEDIASLMGLRVRDALSDRKYHGSYERVAECCGWLKVTCTASSSRSPSVQPAPVLQRIGEAMQQTLDEAAGDARVPVSTLAAMRDAWSTGLSYAREAERLAR